jgi:hypothetical protein
MVEPPSQSLAADDPQLGLVGVTAWGFRRLATHRWLISQRLVRPFLVVILDGFRHKVIHVLLTEHDEVIESLLLQCLDESLDVGVRIRRPKRSLLPFCSRRVEDSPCDTLHDTIISAPKTQALT